MHVHSINTLNNINFDGKLKPKKNVKKNLVNRVITPVIMGALTAQLLKEQIQTGTTEAQQNKGYLKNPLTERENARGYLLSHCFNFYKDPKETQDNIVPRRASGSPMTATSLIFSKPRRKSCSSPWRL